MANKKTNLFTWVLVGAGIALLTNALGKSTPQQPTPTNGGGNNTPTPQPTPTPSVDFPIVYNRFSNAAKQIQIALGLTGNNVDGIVGPKTLALLKKYLPTFTERFKISNAAELQSVLNTINR